MSKYVYLQANYGDKYHLPARYTPDNSLCGMWRYPMRIHKFTDPANEEDLCRKCQRMAARHEKLSGAGRGDASGFIT